MNNIGHPTQFLHRFQHTTRIEDGTFDVVNIFSTLVINKHTTFVEIIIIIDKIYLHTCCLNTCHFDNKWVVGIINNDIHA